MAIDTTKKIKQVTYNGTEIPLSGYDTSDATVTAGDMAYGVVAYGASGKVTGTVQTLSSGEFSSVYADSVFVEGGVFKAKTKFSRDELYRKGSSFYIRYQLSNFGNATAADVAKGKTFTSAAGLKVVGTATGSSAADVTFDLYNNGFENLAVVYMSKTGSVMDAMISNSDHMSITTSEGSMVVLINRDFNGNTIDLVPDNGASIAQGFRTTNVTMFVAGAETNGMNIDVNMT